MSFPTFLILPIVLIFATIEFYQSVKEDSHLYSGKDTAVNLTIGILSLFNAIFAKAMFFVILKGCYSFRVFTLGDSILTWMLALVAWDFSYYWFHRLSHEINWFWASHEVHHSSEKYNLSIALRIPWTAQYSGQFLFWIWMPLVGFDPLMIIIVNQVGLFYQFWLHTETIKKLPPVLEFIFNTPSHHRAHHGSNLKYLDKNHGGVLIIWDRLFGTFQKEDEKPQYGLQEKLHSYNPLEVMFHAWKNMIKNAIKSRSFSTSIKYLFMPPGWSPDGTSFTVKQIRQIEIQSLETIATAKKITVTNKFLNSLAALKALYMSKSYAAVIQNITTIRFKKPILDRQS